MTYSVRRAVAALSVLVLCGCAMHDTVGHAQPTGPVAVFSDDFTGPAGTPPGGPWPPRDEWRGDDEWRGGRDYNEWR